MKTISYDDYLKALALHHMAAEHYKKFHEFEKALTGLLGAEEDDWHIWDTIAGERDFHEALKLMEIVVAPATARATPMHHNHNATDRRSDENVHSEGDR